MRALEAMQEKLGRVKSARKRRELLEQIRSPTKSKSSRTGKVFAKTFHLNDRSVRRTRTGRREQKKKTASRTLRVLTFLQDPQWSVTYPGKKDLICCRYTRYEDGKKCVWRRYIPKVVLTENIEDLWVVYNRQNKDAKVGKAFFFDVRRRSQFIKPLSYASPEVCLCQKHQNYALKLRSIQKYVKVPRVPDTLVRDYTADEFEQKLKDNAKHLPDTIRYEEWKLTPVTITTHKVWS